MKILSSSFSLSMIPRGGVIEVTPVTSLEELVYQSDSGRRRVDEIGVVSCIGHQGTVDSLNKILRLDVPLVVDRKSIELKVEDILYVTQPIGDRLNVGTEVSIPELRFFKVQFHRCKGLGSSSVEQLESCLKSQTFEE